MADFLLKFHEWGAPLYINAHYVIGAFEDLNADSGPPTKVRIMLSNGMNRMVDESLDRVKELLLDGMAGFK